MPLASCHISGIFSLSDGFRQTDPSYYTEYLSSLEFPVDSKFINVSVRKFTPTSEALLPDNTCVFMVAKAALPAGRDGLLDSIYCTPFNPHTNGSEQAMTIDPTHTAFVTGTVRSVNVGGPMKSFVLTTGEFVRGEQRTFDIRCVLFYLLLTCTLIFNAIIVFNTMELRTAGGMFDFPPPDPLSPPPVPLKTTSGMMMISLY